MERHLADGAYGLGLERQAAEPARLFAAEHQRSGEYLISPIGAAANTAVALSLLDRPISGPGCILTLDFGLGLLVL